MSALEQRGLGLRLRSDTLFRLITEGTDELQTHGYARKGRENVVGPMPPYGDIIENSDDLWKIVTFIQSLHKKS